jgi:DNA topoisomerase II
LDFEDEDSETDVKPAPKKSKATIDDFWNDAPTKKASAPTARKASGTKGPASKAKTASSSSDSKPKPAPAKKAPARKKVADSDGDMDDDDDIPVVVPARTGAPKRAARTSAKKMAYVDVLSDDDDAGGGDDSLFQDED